MNEAVKRCCGTCAFGLPWRNDLTKRHCHGNPPQVIVIQLPAQFAPGPPGHPPRMVSPASTQFNNMRPIVGATDPPCAHYEPRSLAQLAQDTEVSNEHTAAETRQ